MAEDEQEIKEAITEEPKIEVKAEPEKRNEEIDIAKAIDVARIWIKKNVGGNLNLIQFKIENVKQNGSNTRYIVVVSLIPDIGEDRDYYLIKVDVKGGKIVTPLGKGKMEEGKIVFTEIKVDPKFEE